MLERNALRANLVSCAEEWRWGSLWRRGHGDLQEWLHRWPVATPANWVEFVNAPQTEAELEAVRRAVVRNCPFGSEAWSERTARELGWKRHCVRAAGHGRGRMMKSRPCSEERRKQGRIELRPL